MQANMTPPNVDEAEDEVKDEDENEDKIEDKAKKEKRSQFTRLLDEVYLQREADIRVK